MNAKPIKLPGLPTIPITIERGVPRAITVSLGGRVLADSRDALVLREAAYPPVLYIPRKDVEMALLERTDHASYCPYKGDAGYLQYPVRRSPLCQCGLDL